MKRTLCIGWFLCILGSVSGMILNSSFEIPDPNETEWFIPPLDWIRANDNPYEDCYAGLHETFVPTPQYDRSITEVDWTIPAPFHESQFVVLSTGDLGLPSDPAITKAEISQIVTFYPGQRISGAYFFGTCDFLEYNDFGKIYLLPVDPNSGLQEIQLGYSDVMIVGDFESSEEWQTFTYDFTQQTAGTYYLICTVQDVRDAIYKSYLAVDGLKVCTPLYSYGDINMDCSVDFEDLGILSRAWLSFCPDPNFYDPNNPDDVYLYTDFDPNTIDPNCPCEIADINNDWFVDPNDLTILSDHLLENGF